MGEIAINPIHNVHKQYRKVNLVNTYISTPPVTYNTYIGGISASVSSAALLASKLGISVGAISNFTIVGADIKCKITGSYSMPGNCWASNSAITYFRDFDGLVTSISVGGIDDNGQCIEWYFPNCLSIAKTVENYSFHNNHTQGVILYTPRCTDWGGTQGTDGGMFLNIGNALDAKGFTIYAPIAMQTSNSGGVEGDLAAAIVGGYNTLKYVSNFTVPNPVTTLAAGTIYNTAIQLNFTPPSSTNAIDYYECYANGFYKNKITGSGQFISNLIQNTNYNITVYAVDIFYNKSLISNIVNITTTNSLADTDAAAYTTASSNTAYQYVIQDLFKMLKDNSLYSKMQAFYPFLGTTLTQQKWNGKNPLDTNSAFRLTFNGGGTFSDLGYQCNGTNAYANTYFVPSVNQNVNSNGLTLTIGTNNTLIPSSVWEIGTYVSATQTSLLSAKENNSNYAVRAGFNTTTYASRTGVNDAKGIITGSKTASNVHKLLKNGSLLATSTGGGTLSNTAFYIGALNNPGGVAGNFSNQRIQFVAFHEGLSDAEVVILHTIIDTFETALGRKTW